jgi:hypothetical protein
MADTSSSYPVNLEIEYPDRKLNRLTSFFRVFMVVPIALILVLVSGGPSWNMGDKGQGIAIAAGGILFLPALLMILFRQKYPRWWFDWNVNLAKFSARVSAYVGLLTDTYPSTDEEQSVHVTIDYPDAKADLKRGMPLVKWFLAIPHYIVLAALAFAAVVVWIIAWFAILFTGKYPRGMFDFVVGVGRWGLRVGAYAFMLVTDKYPPFRLEA